MFWNELKYNDQGLVCGIFQDYKSGEVLTLAWMNREAVQKTFEDKKVWLYRRSHGKLMMKGEQSGNVQIVHDMIIDCDRDALVVKIEQVGEAACHKGYRSCFFEQVKPDGTLEAQGKPLFDPAEVYKK
ncbi:MAG TPA: phosphoribosyl-AMP cyclohydrolase [Abditibacteriaceae bacterium]|jgi:phosphoribosyl-AMP cyclohydrolase